MSNEQRLQSLESAPVPNAASLLRSTRIFFSERQTQRIDSHTDLRSVRCEIFVFNDQNLSGEASRQRAESKSSSIIGAKTLCGDGRVQTFYLFKSKQKYSSLSTPQEIFLDRNQEKHGADRAENVFLLVAVDDSQSVRVDLGRL